MAAPGGGLTAWTLESRWRYALLWGGLGALVVVGLAALFGSRSGSDILWLGIGGLLIAVLAQALIWYPRAKAKASSEHTKLRVR